MTFAELVHKDHLRLDFISGNCAACARILGVRRAEAGDPGFCPRCGETLSRDPFRGQFFETCGDCFGGYDD